MTEANVHTWALIPVKDFAAAKGRLADVLAPADRSALAEAMLRDVIAALDAAKGISGISLVGGADARRIAKECDLNWLVEREPSGLNAALNMGANELEQQGLGSVLILPDDLPTLTGPDITALLDEHTGGLSVSPATNDGGTNALLISPPNAIAFQYGRDSARRHLQAGLAAGLPARTVCLPAFNRDIDQPDDLQWLRTQRPGQHTADVLSAIDRGSLLSAAAVQG
ncbi:MAG: 2-phospho-L-lactate guanylyltransferase [Gammaproteobacteria bacterium]